MQKQSERAAIYQLVEQTGSVSGDVEIRRDVGLAFPMHGQGVDAVGQVGRKLGVDLFR